MPKGSGDPEPELVGGQAGGGGAIGKEVELLFLDSVSPLAARAVNLLINHRALTAENLSEVTMKRRLAALGGARPWPWPGFVVASPYAWCKKTPRNGGRAAGGQRSPSCFGKVVRDPLDQALLRALISALLRAVPIPQTA